MKKNKKRKKCEVGLRILAPVTQSKDDTKLEAKLRGLPEPDPGEKNKKRKKCENERYMKRKKKW